MSTLINKFLVASVTVGAALMSIPSFAAALGELESNGRFEVRAADTQQFVRINEPGYTWFSGDTIRTRGAPATLNLSNGGGFGFTANAEVTITVGEQGQLQATIESGTLVYALPGAANELAIQAGNFSLSTQSQGVQSVNVNTGPESVGMVERLQDGNISVMVQQGELFVQNGQAVRYQVSAGESVGLLDRPEIINTQAGTPPPRVSLNAPSEVGSGQPFTVDWTSSAAAEGDYVVISESGANADQFESLVSTGEGETLSFTAPVRPGSYEIRFIDAQTGAISQMRAIEVISAAPAAASVGAGGATGASRVLGGLFAIGAGVVAVSIVDDATDDDEPVEPVRPVSP